MGLLNKLAFRRRAFKPNGRVCLVLSIHNSYKLNNLSDFVKGKQFNSVKSRLLQYGRSPRGIRGVEVVRYHQRPHYTLNLLIGTGGVSFANVVDGATTGADFVDFFGQAVNNVDNIGEPILRNGDCVIVDNCPTHHGQFGEYLRNYLGDRGIDLIYTPRYSPEMNPAEYAFNKIKFLSKQKYYRDMMALNVGYTIMELVSEITPNDAVGFFRHTNYLQI